MARDAQDAQDGPRVQRSRRWDGHVAIILLAPFASGAEHQTLALCRYLRQRCRVTLLVNDEFAGLLADDPFLRRYAAGLPVERLGPAFPSSPAASVRGLAARAAAYPRLQLTAWRALRRLRPSIVHLVLAPSFFAYAPLFHALPVPVVLTLSGEMRYVRHFYGAAKRAIVRYAVRRADALVVCSADELANLRLVVPSSLHKAVLIDNFTDVARFAPSPAKERLATFAARLHPEKGALLFVEAVAQARQRVPEARFALMGRGEQAPLVARRLAQLGLEGAVAQGFATDLAPLLARSLVFVSCQRYENLGSASLLEAMASGNAVVATDVGQTAQIVDETVGVRVPAEPCALADALAGLLADPDRAARLGRAARQRVLEQYGPDRYVEALLGVYQRAGERRLPVAPTPLK
jgi:glycosyltransferase involved in cell wall biosynthesis